MQKFVRWLFFALICLSVTAAWWVAKDYLFPYVTTKAFFFRILVEAAFPLYVYLLISDKQLRPSKKNPLLWLLLAFVAANFISAFVGVDVVRGLWGNFERMGGAYYTAHLVALAFYALMLGQMPGKYFQWFLKFLLFSGFVVAALGVSSWLHLGTLVPDPSLPTRVSSTLGNPIYLGSYLIIPLYIALFFAVQAEGLAKRVGYYFLAFIFLFAIYLSATRGAVVGLVAGSFLCAVAYVALVKNKKIRFWGLGAVAAFVAIAALLFTFNGKLPQGSTLQRLFRLKDSNTEARLIQWKIALTGYKDRPIFGVGPENYYIVANKYYDPKIYQYDPSWFDKPHNYLLEILVTDGAVGFLVYAALLVFMVLALYKGFKAGLFSLAQFSLLLGGLLAYQVQNFTVFDTVPASLMFYSFAGFCAYIWAISKEDVKPLEKRPSKKTITAGPHPFALAAGGVAVVIMAYSIYITNVMQLQAAKAVNYGYAYAGVDPSKALAYFETAIALPFNFDQSETASRFGEFAQGLARGATAQNQALANKALDESISYLENTTQVQPNNPILWQRLATAYLVKSSQSGVVDPRVAAAVQKAVDLAPLREESFLIQAQVKAFGGDFAGAQNVLLQDLSYYPKDHNGAAQLAIVERLQGNLDAAVKTIESAIDQGYVFSSAADSKWVVDYYVKQKEFDKAIDLQTKATTIDPNSIQPYADLAKVYAAAGRYDQAKQLATQIIQAGDPTTTKEMRDLLATLPK